MATVDREAIETFMSITGASENVAVQRLEASSGNLNEAVNSHFCEGDGNTLQEAPVTVTAPPNDFMDIDDPPGLEPLGLPSLLSATRGVMNPFSLLDQTLSRGLLDSRNLFDHSSELLGRTRGPYVSQPREVRQIPIEFRDGLGNSTGHGPRIEDVTDIVDSGGPETHGTVIINEEDGDNISGNLRGNQSYSRISAPQFDDAADDGNDIEEEMIRAAIEASKRDTVLHNNEDLIEVGPQQRAPQSDDIDTAHAISLSLRTAEHEKMQRELILKSGVSGSSADKPFQVEELSNIDEPLGRQGVDSSKPSSSQRTKEAGSSSVQDEADEYEQPLIRNRSSRRSSGSVEAEQEIGETDVTPALSPPLHSVDNQSELNGNAFPSHEWGGISNEEHDEAVMLEAAMFGGVPESGYNAPYVPHHPMGPGLSTAWTGLRPPSPNLVSQRAIREQQDDEYLASLQADREKEMKAVAEEKAAREASVQEQKRKEEEALRKLQEDQELESQLAVKQASLPEEPELNDENAVNLMVRMPDGSRHGRRFHRSDKLQCLFDFIDVGRMVRPGTYRLVRPYPRQAFSDGESNLALIELGLTSKQEALFLELI